MEQWWQKSWRRWLPACPQSTQLGSLFFCTTTAKWTVLFFAYLFSVFGLFCLADPKKCSKIFWNRFVPQTHRERASSHTLTARWSSFQSGHSHQQKIEKSRRPRNSFIAHLIENKWSTKVNANVVIGCLHHHRTIKRKAARHILWYRNKWRTVMEFWVEGRIRKGVSNQNL